MAQMFFLAVCIVAAFVLAIRRAPLWGWAVAVAVAAYAWQGGVFGGGDQAAGGLVAWAVAAVLAALAIPALRRGLLIAPLFAKIRAMVPKVSATEQEALDAGTIGFDAELFSGTPDWGRLAAVPPITLTEEEKAFLDGPVNELCRMANDWQIRHTLKEVPAHIWEFVKAHGFLGMLISKQHGGLGFSAQAQSLVLGRIASRSPDV